MVRKEGGWDGLYKAIIGFLGQFRQMSSQFNHRAILFRAKTNAIKKSHSISFLISQI